MPIAFNRGVRFLGALADLPSGEELRHTPQFYRADPDFVRRSGNPFLRRFLEATPMPKARYLSVDTKVHMLMPGFYACIPGWHCDDFHRPTGEQPDLTGIQQAWSEHVAVVVGDTAFTEFAVEELSLPGTDELERDGRPVYGVYHDLIEAKAPRTRRAKSGEPVAFSCRDFHRGTPADRRSWRLFARITASDHREPKNELRSQTQVYLTAPFEQW